MPRNRLTPLEALEGERRPLRESVKQYMDYDYVAKLAPEDKEWLSQFNRMYYLDLKASVTELQVKPKVQRELYETTRIRRSCVNLTDRRCSPLAQSTSTPSPLDAYIAVLDLLKNKNNPASEE